MKRRLLALLWLGLLAPFATALADIYVARAADGTLILTNLPRQGERYLQVFREGAVAHGSLVRPQSAQLAGQRPYADLVERAAQRHDLPPALLHAVIQAESAYDPQALSPKGAAGLMQLMPDTAVELGVGDVWSPAQNIDGGARYLRQLLNRFDQDLTLAVAAYNAGPGAVLRSGRRVPAYAETQRYVPHVLLEYRRLQDGR